ncbi:alpha/beta hydrolase [Rhodoferax sp.]|uniref:alpha/beta hydrolase n=1 Tax=Rhodoferax sp. TaxID=50421 RepID=UPI002ACEEE5F|nr:alpha/beta hydrolase [Rhodoferax sp.]MDZ7921123.1 alpha/beta hydrolase [Rhodoferax sp.]
MSHHHDPHANPRALLTPAMRSVVDRIARAGHVPMHALSAPQARVAYAAGANVLELPTQKLPRVEDFTVSARDGHPIPVRHYAPLAGPLPVLIYFHGGGFTVGSIATHDGLCRRLAHLAGCAVLSVDYRLAPDSKFPTAHNDAWDVVQWAAGAGTDGKWDTTRIALGGDSAGGTLAAACAIEARDAGLDLSLQLLFYPGCAGHQNTPSHHTFAKGFVIEEPHITYFFEQYIRTPADRDDWRFAPLDGKGSDGFEVDLAGVAPAWVGLAECDPLVDEGIAYADRLRMASVPVDLEIYRSMVHEFIKMGRAIPEAATAHADAARALRAAFSTH